MKHIQKYNQFNENLDQYNVGDYVLQDIDKISEEYNVTEDDAAVLIIDELDEYYKVEYSDLDFSHVEKCDIIRRLTPKEIEDYNAKKNSFKYNI